MVGVVSDAGRSRVVEKRGRRSWIYQGGVVSSRPQQASSGLARLMDGDAGPDARHDGGRLAMVTVRAA